MLQERRFGEEGWMNPLDRRITNMLAQQNSYCSVHNLQKSVTHAQVLLNKAEKENPVTIDPALEPFTGGVIIPVDYLLGRYTTYEGSMPKFVSFPDVLYARLNEHGKVVVQPLDVKGGLNLSVQLSASQVSAANTYNLYQHNPLVKQAVRKAARHFKKRVGNTIFADGFIITDLPTPTNDDFTAYARELGGWQRVLTINPDEIRLEKQRESKQGITNDDAYRITPGKNGVTCIANVKRLDRESFKQELAHVMHSTGRQLLHPTPFTVVRGFHPKTGEALVSHEYQPTKGLTQYTDFRLERLEARIASIERAEGLADAAQRQAFAMEGELIEARKRVAHVKRTLSQLSTRIQDEESRTAAKERLEQRCLDELSQNGLVHAMEKPELGVKQRFLVSLQEQVAYVQRKSQDDKVLSSTLRVEEALLEISKARRLDFERPTTNEYPPPLMHFLAHHYRGDSMRAGAELQSNMKRKKLSTLYFDAQQNVLGQIEALREAKGGERGKLYHKLFNAPLLSFNSVTPFTINNVHVQETFPGLLSEARQLLAHEQEYKEQLERIAKAKHPKKTYRGLRRSVRRFIEQSLGEALLEQAMPWNLLRDDDVRREQEKKIAGEARRLKEIVHEYEGRFVQHAEKERVLQETYARLQREYATKETEARVYEGRLTKLVNVQEALARAPKKKEHHARLAAALDGENPYESLQAEELSLLHERRDEWRDRVERRRATFNKEHARVARKAFERVETGGVHVYYLDCKAYGAAVYKVSLIPKVQLAGVEKTVYEFVNE